MTYQYHFGRKPSPYDARDYNLKDFIPRGVSTSLITERVWEFPYPEPLDQKNTNHCVGFSMANFGINMPTFTPYVEADGHNFYYQCKIIDGDPDGEDGTYIRSAAKVLQQNGSLANYAFARDMASIKWWILNKSPMIVGTIWTMNMFLVNENNIITSGGDIVGGHAYLLNEWRADDYIGIQNSWGNSWGTKGKAYISAADFETIFSYGGEALSAVEVEKKTTHECFLKEFFAKLFV